MMPYLLTCLVFAPLVFALVVAFIPSLRALWIRWISLVGIGLQSVLIFGVLGKPLQEQVSWIKMDLGDWGMISIEYYLKADGIAFPLLLLMGIIMPIGLLASWKIQKQVKAYFLLYLILSCSIAGTFLARDFFLFYLFFEFMLLPMYFLIGIWGGKRSHYASIKFFLYTLAGSLLIFIAMMAIHLSVMDPVMSAEKMGWSGAEEAQSQQALLGSEEPMPWVRTFNLDYIYDSANYLDGSLMDPASERSLWGLSFRLWMFLCLFIGFLIKLPAVPFHTWLPDAHVEAPTPISVVLAAVLLKVGAYGFIRFVFPVIPEGVLVFDWLIAGVGVLSILYGAANAFAMKDLKKMIAYSSVSHMGFVLLGLAAMNVEGVQGAMYQLVSHGLISAMLFLIAGVIYDRTGDRTILNYSGLNQRMPQYTVMVVIAFFASLGLPGFSGFIAELLILLGAFRPLTGFSMVFSLLAVLGILLTAVYYLRTLQRMFLGPFWMKNAEQQIRLKDLGKMEKLLLWPLAFLIIIFGLFPFLLTDLMALDVQEWSRQVMGKGLELLSN